MDAMIAQEALSAMAPVGEIHQAPKGHSMQFSDLKGQFAEWKKTNPNGTDVEFSKLVGRSATMGALDLLRDRWPTQK